MQSKILLFLALPHVFAERNVAQEDERQQSGAESESRRHDCEGKMEKGEIRVGLSLTYSSQGLRKSANAIRHEFWRASRVLEKAVIP